MDNVLRSAITFMSDNINGALVVKAEMHKNGDISYHTNDEIVHVLTPEEQKKFIRYGFQPRFETWLT